MRIFIIVSVLFYSFCSQGQNNMCFEMTNQQMLEDLSYLQFHIKTYCALLPLQEKRTGIDLDKEFKQLKEKTLYAHTNKDFVYIVRQAFIFLNDGHSSLANKQMILSKAYAGSENLNTTDAEYADYYYSLCTDSIFPKIKSGIRTKYIDGKYYNVRPFIYNNRYIKPGEEITAINNIPINDFIQKNICNLYFSEWDDIHQRWYDEYFSFAFPLEKFKLKIGDENIEIDNNRILDNLQKEYSYIDTHKMMVINQNILYIRIPIMDTSEWYMQQLYKYYSPSIKKVILDVRANPGGGDGVWWDILSSLIEKPLTFHINIGFNQKNEIISTSPKIKYYEKGLDGNINTFITLNPKENSVNFNGKFYVLKDKNTFSAASSLTSVAWQKDSMKLIGESYGPIVGAGFPAFIFTLPNSRITFTLSYTIDLSGKNENPYMNKVEVPIDDSIDDYIDKVLHYNPYGIEYLLIKDKMIKAVIND